MESTAMFAELERRHAKKEERARSERKKDLLLSLGKCVREELQLSTANKRKPLKPKLVSFLSLVDIAAPRSASYEELLSLVAEELGVAIDVSDASQSDFSEGEADASMEEGDHDDQGRPSFLKARRTKNKRTLAESLPLTYASATPTSFEGHSEASAATGVPQMAPESEDENDATIGAHFRVSPDVNEMMKLIKSRSKHWTSVWTSLNRLADEDLQNDEAEARKEKKRA